MQRLLIGVFFCVVVQIRFVSAQLRVSTPNECPSLAGQVSTILGSEWHVHGQAIDWVVTREASGYLGRVWMRGGVDADAHAAQRELQARDCTELTRAAAVVLALALDPERAQEFLQREAEAQTADETAASEMPANPDSTPPPQDVQPLPDPDAASSSWQIVLGATFNYGWATEIRPGVAARGGIVRSHWSVGFGVISLPWSEVRFVRANGNAAQLDVRQVALELSLGYAFSLSSWLILEPWLVSARDYPKPSVLG